MRWAHLDDLDCQSAPHPLGNATENYGQSRQNDDPDFAQPKPAQPNRNRFEFVRVLFLIVIMLRSQPGVCAMGARIRASRMCPAQIAQTAQPKGQSQRRAAQRFLLQCSMAVGGGGAGGGVTVTGTGRKQFFYF